MALLLGGLASGLLASGVSTAEENPRFVRRLIRQFEAAPVEVSPRSIVRYEYRGASVYYVPVAPYSCCDLPSRLYDSRGTLVCAPDGGYTGKGDGKCADFTALRSNRTVVWNDPRVQRELDTPRPEGAPRPD